MSFKSPFLQEAQARGFIHQGTDLAALDQTFCQGPVTAYVGFDATADSLHVGSLVGIMLARLLQKHGHKPLIVMGGATSRIGDPSGKTEARPLLTEADIQHNIHCIQKIFKCYLSFGEGPTDAVLLDNATWLHNLNYIDFLRNYGRHFSVNRMLTFDVIKTRLDQEKPLSFLELNYMIFQAYDFLVLNQKYACQVQFGGSDQWGNIVNGVDLVRRIQSQEVYGLTTPLITTAGGSKMGKTAQGAIWLRADRLSPYDYWQFWRNTDDRDVVRYLHLFTDLPLEQLNSYKSMEGEALNNLKKSLADATITLAHGPACLAEIHATVQKLFGSESSGDLSSLPAVTKSDALLSVGIPLIDLMCEIGLTSSKGEARRLIRGGGARVNDGVICDETFCVTSTNLDAGTVKISAGKKRHGVVYLASPNKG